MQQSYSKAGKNLFYSVIALVLSLTLGASAVFAWFVINNNSSLGDIDLRVQSDNVSNVTLLSYAVSEISENGSQKVYTLATGQNGLVALAEIPDYDVEGIAMNEYRPVLAINISFTVSAGDYYAVVAKAGKGWQTAGDQNWLSNCAQFFAAEYNGGTTLNSTGLPKTFITVQGTPSKSGSITLTSDVFNEGEHDLWFVMEYNEQALALIHQNNDPTEFETIQYNSDISLEIRAL